MRPGIFGRFFGPAADPASARNGSGSRTVQVAHKVSPVDPKPYKFIGFGDSCGPKPYKFRGLVIAMAPNPINMRPGRPLCYARVLPGQKSGLPGRIVAGLLPGTHRNRPPGRPSAGRGAHFVVFPGNSPATIRPGRPLSGPEALLRDLRRAADRRGRGCSGTPHLDFAASTRSPSRCEVYLFV